MRVRECVYSYCDANGRERFQRVRWRLDPPLNGRTKEIKYRWRYDSNHAWVYRMAQMPDWDVHRHLIYNLPTILEEVARGGDIWWTEGEKDANALIELGIAATTHHGGAGNMDRE